MKTILSILGLCIGFWSLPAVAGPFDDQDESSARRDDTQTIQLEDYDSARALRGRMPSVIPSGRPEHDLTGPVLGTLPSPIQNDRSGHDEPSGWSSYRASGQPLLDSPRRLSAVAGIPEPSAVTLFGIGVLVALQAIPRRARQS